MFSQKKKLCFTHYFNFQSLRKNQRELPDKDRSRSLLCQIFLFLFIIFDTNNRNISEEHTGLMIKCTVRIEEISEWFPQRMGKKRN